MRKLLVWCGVAAILCYAAIGAWMMLDWEVVAASGLPLPEAIEQIEAGGETYEIWPAIVFAIAGVALGFGWALVVLRNRPQVSARAALGGWGAIMGLGALAYFYSSFSNLMAVGDTIEDWHSEAAFAVASRLYLASAVAVAIAVVGMVSLSVGAGRPGRSGSTGS